MQNRHRFAVYSPSAGGYWNGRCWDRPDTAIPVERDELDEMTLKYLSQDAELRPCGGQGDGPTCGAA